MTKSFSSAVRASSSRNNGRSLFISASFFTRAALAIFALCCLAAAPVRAGETTINPETVEIVRDNYGVPHVFAPTDAAAAYGLAWAQCEDRFRDVQRAFLLGSGRMGRAYGISGAVVDYFAAYIQADSIAKAEYYALLDEEYRAFLSGYVAGINAYARKYPEKLMDEGLFPISGVDALKSYLVILNGAIGVPDAIMAIRKGAPESFMFRPGANGSNAFAFAPKKTTDGSTLLVMNPHVQLSGLLAFYEARLRSEEGLDFYGAFIPGLPTPAMGTNRKIGWAVTFNWPDFVDIYELKINPKNKNQYLLDGQWRNFKVKKARLKARIGFLPVGLTKKIRYSAHGPVFPGKKGKVYATRYVQRNPCGAAEQWYWMARAENLAEFKAALAPGSLPLFNFMYADRKGNIYYKFNALLPERRQGIDWQNTIDGTRADLIWQNYLPLEATPAYENPECGYLYNTNNSPFKATCAEENLRAADYDTTCGFDWNRENNRDFRFRELIAKHESVSEQDVEAIKYDVQYPAAGPIQQSLQAFRRMNPVDWPEISDALHLLRDWDLRGDSTSRKAGLFVVTMYYLYDDNDVSLVELESGHQFEPEEIAKALRKASRFLLREHGRLDPPLADVQRLKRGQTTRAAAGLPETLRPVYGYLRKKDGYLRQTAGDTFIGFLRFGDEGQAAFRTALPYGNSNRPGSDFFDDQLDLYAQGRVKTVVFDESRLRLNASRVYHPQ